MRKRDRPVPFKFGTDAYRHEFARLRAKGVHWRVARMLIRCINHQARQTPTKGEKCEARTRQGTPCQAPAGWNGRCRNHGGLTTGPKTPEGKKKSLAAIGQKPFEWKQPPAVQAAIKRREKEIAERARARIMGNGERQ